MDDKSITHFGITMALRTRGYKLIRENYAVISNKSTNGKNVIYMHALKKNDEKLIKAYSEIYADKEGLIYRDDWCKKHLVEVSDYSCSGYYVMILDKYCQLYIGTTRDIKKRVREHIF